MTDNDRDALAAAADGVRRANDLSPFPLLVRESNHPIFIADRLRPAILR